MMQRIYVYDHYGDDCGSDDVHFCRVHSNNSLNFRYRIVLCKHICFLQTPIQENMDPSLVFDAISSGTLDTLGTVSSDKMSII